jgi:Tol biopolymer transport system component/DNA-binding winged helix-turn-helix (wHTH) protein
VAAQYRWDDYVLDLDAFRLERGGVPISLEPKAVNVLAFLVQRPNRLVTKQELFESIWPDTAVTDHALTRVIAQLRRALGDEAREAKYIETVPTRGYRWIRPLATELSPSAAVKGTDVSDAVGSSQPSPVASSAAAVAPSGTMLSRRSIAALVVLALAVGALAASMWAQREVGSTAGVTSDDPTRRHAVMWPVQVTTRSGLDLQPAIAPAGDAIAYVSDRSGSLEIYVRALGGTGVDTPLTADGGQNVQPAWSPDGRFIAYHSSRQGGIWIIPARGGVPRQIAAEGSNPAWSPDGARLAFQTDEPADVTPSAWGAQVGSTIWTVHADGSQLTPLTQPGQPIGGHAAPAWSRDGRFVAFTVFEGALENGVWRVATADGDVAPLARGPGLYELVFAADSRSIYAAGGEAFLLRIGIDPQSGRATDERELIPIAGVPGVRGLSISGDGHTLAFSGLALSSQIWAQPIGPDGKRAATAYAITSDTSRRNSLATMSPDGSRIAYMSTRGGAPPDVWVMNADGSSPLSLTHDESSDGKPTWFPDSTRVAYVSNRNNTLGLWSVDIHTRRHALLFDYAKLRNSDSVEGIGRLAELHLAPSVTRIAFSALTRPSGRRRLHVATLAPFAVRALTDGSESIGYPAWSPDERSLAVEIKDGSSTQAGIVDVSTGAVRRLTNARGQSWVRSWSPDSRKVAMAALRDGLWSLRWIDVNSGHEEIITPALPPHVYVRYPEWSPRGDVVLFERGELRGNIWTLQVR